MTIRRVLIAALLFLCLGAAGAASAADSVPSLVGRVSAVIGGGAVRAAGGDWVDSAVNDPVAAGMSVRTGAQGRALLRVGPDIVALAPGTEIDLDQLDGSAMQIALRQGRIGVRSSNLDPARSIEIDIPRGGVWLLTPGDYEVAAGDDHTPAQLAVPDGCARFVGGGIDTIVATGSAATLGPGAPATANLDPAAQDDFTAWWRGSDGTDVDPVALRYVDPDMTGYEALDDNGTWKVAAGYGAVWFPTRVPVDWAPYRDGRWRWIKPWGWTWIDDMTWGFAPSHYGRWARFATASPGGGRWGWVPGKSTADPIFVPAAVAFLGTAAVGLSYPGGNGPGVGWFPLAPGEIYWPRYTGDIDLIRRINRGAVPDPAEIPAGVDGQPPVAVVNGDYRNRQFASVVPRPVFVGGQPVAPALVQLPRQRLENAPVLAGSPQIGPPAPHPVTVTAAVAALRTGVAPRLAGAMRTLVRILKPRGKSAHRPAVVAHREHGPAEHRRAPDRHPGVHVVAASWRPSQHHRRLAALHRR